RGSAETVNQAPDLKREHDSRFCRNRKAVPSETIML
ncbi:MAG: hypothetical protein ACI8Y6_002027, partial [Brevundimonas sp.]